MGMASSQARLLSLTSRMHQIEYKAAKLEAHKLQMANESDQVYEEYLNALENTKVQRKVLTTDGSVTYKDIDNYQADFLDNNFAIAFNNTIYAEDGLYDGAGNVIYTATSPDAIIVDASNQAALEAAVGSTLAIGSTVYKYTNYQNGDETYTTTPISGLVSVGAFGILTHDAFDADPTDPPTNVKDVITNLINSGQCVIVTKEPSETWDSQFLTDPQHLTSVSTNTNLQEVKNEAELRKAEAKYEADMKKIDRKERYYDQQLAAMDQERNAIKQEIDTLKTVAKENVERTFKLFG